MQRIQNIEKWKHVAAGGAMNFEYEWRRTIRLDVNAAGTAALFYVDGNGETTFLALVTGRDVVEFQCQGDAFSIVVEDADAWFYTIDGERMAVSLPDAVKFTKLIERRQRNPEVELMRYHMEATMKGMMEHQQRELDRRIDRLAAASAAPAAKPVAKGDAGGAGSEPEPDGGAGTGKGAKSSDGSDGAKAGA